MDSALNAPKPPPDLPNVLGGVLIVVLAIWALVRLVEAKETTKREQEKNNRELSSTVLRDLLAQKQLPEVLNSLEAPVKELKATLDALEEGPRERAVRQLSVVKEPVAKLVAFFGKLKK